MALEQPLQRCLIPCTRTIDEMKRRLRIGATQSVTVRRLRRIDAVFGHSDLARQIRNASYQRPRKQVLKPKWRVTESMSLCPHFSGATFTSLKKELRICSSCGWRQTWRRVVTSGQFRDGAI
jgi:hypothetical protein